MKLKTLKVNRDYLASNRVYNKELGGFVAPDLLTNKQFKNTIKNSEVYDTKIQFRNLNYEELLDKAVGQHLLILDYEENITDKICEISELEKKIENLEQSIMIQTYKY